MVGQPFKQQVVDKLELAGGWENVFERIASGETIERISQSFGVTPHSGWFRSLMNGDPERRRRNMDAQRFAAEAFAEEGLQIVDNAPETREGIAKAEMRARYRRYLAAVYNRERFSESAPLQVNAQVNISLLQLAALRDLPQRPEIVRSEIVLLPSPTPADAL